MRTISQVSLLFSHLLFLEYTPQPSQPTPRQPGSHMSMQPTPHYQPPVASTPLPQVQQPAPAPVAPVVQQANGAAVTGFSELDADTAQPPWRKEGNDWVAVFNPKSPVLQQDHLNVDLVHNLDHESVVCCVKFSLCGKFLATGCNRYAQIFDVETGQKLCTLFDESAASESSDLYIRSVVFSPDARFLAAGAEDRVIRIWDIQSRRVKLHLQGHEQDIYSLDWTRDGKYVVSGSGDKTIKVWDTETSQCVLSMSNEDDKLSSPGTQPGAQPKDSGVTSVSLNPVYGRCVAAVSVSLFIHHHLTF